MKIAGSLIVAVILVVAGCINVSNTAVCLPLVTSGVALLLVTGEVIDRYEN